MEGAVLIAERWIIARLRNWQFFDLAALNAEITGLLELINSKTTRRVGRSRREMFEQIERVALKPLPVGRLESAEWKAAEHEVLFLRIDSHAHEYDRDWWPVLSPVLRLTAPRSRGQKERLPAKGE